jgi:histidine triad (HIT) family protein
MNDCIFCKIVKGEAKSWKVYEDEYVYAFLDINPVNEYHTLVIPRAHYRDIFDIPVEELAAVMQVVKKLALLYRDRLGICNLQIIQCSGREAQQDVFHIHFHLVPRKRGDHQDVHWNTHPEWVGTFDMLLERLNGDL